jgi:ribosomal protein S27AE
VVVSAVRAHLGFRARPAGRVTVVTRRPVQSAPAPETAAAAAAFLDGQEITTTNCRRCGTEISGIHGRYSCGPCGWTNHWSEGHNVLPTADDDPDA